MEYAARLLVRQAESLGLPFARGQNSPQCVTPSTKARMETAMREQLTQGVRHVAFGDIFLQDLRNIANAICALSAM